MNPRLLSTARRSFPLVASIAALIAGRSAHSVSLYWDTDGTGTAGSGAATGISGTSIQIDAAGAMLLSGTSGTQVNDAAAVNLNGDRLGFSNVASQTETLGVLALSASSTLDFGAGGGNDTFLFAGLPTRTGGTTLTIDNWIGNSAGGGDGTEDRLVFLGDVVDPLSFASVFGQGDVAFTGFGSGYVAIPSGTTSYEIVPVPEPSSAALLGAAALLGLVGFRKRQRLPGTKRSHP